MTVKCNRAQRCQVRFVGGVIVYDCMIQEMYHAISMSMRLRVVTVRTAYAHHLRERMLVSHAKELEVTVLPSVLNCRAHDTLHPTVMSGVGGSPCGLCRGLLKTHP